MKGGAYASLLPNVDPRTGLCIRECECVRCSQGYRPTEAQRRHAETSIRAAAELKADQEQKFRTEKHAAEARALNAKRSHERISETAVAQQAERERLAALSPLTAEELEEMRAAREALRKGVRR